MQIQPSKKWFERLKQTKKRGTPYYKIARAANPPVYPPDLSKIIHNGLPLKAGDKRIVAIGRLLGLSAAECFAEEGEV